MTKYLGIDFGTKKCGLALSDEGGTLAFPHSVVPSDDAFLPLVERLIETESVDAVVIGESKNQKGEDNPVMEHIRDFVGQLSLTAGVPIHFEKEFFTTRQAKEHTSDALADASAAALILQSFLDKQS